MAKGIFPQMSIPDIINSLAGWGISVSPDQLKSPNSEFVESVYCACLQQVTDLSHDSLQDPVQNALAISQAEDKVRWPPHLPFLYTESGYYHPRTFMHLRWLPTLYCIICMGTVDEFLPDLTRFIEYAFQRLPGSKTSTRETFIAQKENVLFTYSLRS
jgi:hypothetical protein